MKAVHLKWSVKSEEGYVRFPEGWDDHDWVLKMDCLKDWIHLLQMKYDALLASDTFTEFTNQ